MNISALVIILLTILNIIKGEIENRDPIKVIAHERNASAEFELELTFGEDAEYCELCLPNGITFQFIPDSNLTDPNIEIKKDVYGHHICGFKIFNVTSKYVGGYKITAIINNIFTSSKHFIQPLNVIVEEKLKAIPNDDYYVFPGQNLQFNLPESLENVQKCDVIPPNTTLEKNFSSVADNCITSIYNLTKENAGIWIVKAISDIILYTEVNITIKEIPYIENNITIVQGTQTLLKLGPTASIFCQATNPNGQIVTENSGQCEIKINRVTQRDNGTWIVKFGLSGSMSTFVYEYYIHVIDIGERNEGEILTHFDTDKNKTFLQIECTLFVKSMTSCRVIRADGEVFMLNQGIGSGRYKYFASKRESLEIGDDFVNCGIHIEKPNTLDMEPWKCVIVHGENNTETGSVINLNQSSNINNTNENLGILTTTSINVSKSNSFNMICTFPLSISYCWFKAPNGTLLSLLPGSSHENYEYFGNGLKMGHCGIKIKTASISDQGTWNCNLGTSEIKDFKENIHVNVFETPLVAQRNHYSINKGDSIYCKTFDNSSLEYCRFVQPNGDGINPSMNSALYSDAGSDLDAGYCSLSLLSPTDIDEGIWFCIGKPYFKNIEYFDTFYVGLNDSYNHAYLIYSIFMGIFFIALIVTMFMIFIIILKKLREPHENQIQPQSITISNRNDLQKHSLA